ncbi:hypothetical protein J6590_035697 [Homalodisca vitripennis]|nr:hypothetical protein J6590_035697 [Homalodisca vitripennis]
MRTIELGTTHRIPYMAQVKCCNISYTCNIDCHQGRTKRRTWQAPEKIHIRTLTFSATLPLPHDSSPLQSTTTTTQIHGTQGNV